MKNKFFFIVIILLSLCACSPSLMEVDSIKEGNSTREASFYWEEVLEFEANDQINISCDWGNIEFYSWDKKGIKFEINKIVRGVLEKELLEEKLDDLMVNISDDNNKIYFDAKWMVKRKNVLDKWIDMRVYLPGNINDLNINLDKGNIKFYDDIKGQINADLNISNVDINRFEGVINIKGNKGNVKISNGKISGKSSIVKSIGNISIKSQFEEGGEYFFDTGTGNIELITYEGSKISIESVGILDKNDFTKHTYPTKVWVSSGIGRISIIKY
ncbi:UNVERIFIED_CONTAM: hypothetical protein Cloal_4250 [Acetivibrio alkalicellulosi]